jgi:type 1 glutamine amidotransferase
MKWISALTGAVAFLTVCNSAFSKEWLTFEGKEGPGKGKHIVLLAGDEEYRSEEALPMLGKILSQRHGFKCSVLFAQNPTDGTINPNNQTNTPGMHLLKDADLVIMMWRYRELPDDQMKFFVDYLNAGKPIIGLRTSTHAFNYTRNKQSPYAKYDCYSKEWPGGFGQQVLGDTWVSHHGNHKKESTRGVINESLKNHPILRGVSDMWGPTDVYGIAHLPADAQVLVYGEVLEGMKPDDKPLEGPKNHPMMPVTWIRDYKTETGNTSRIFCSTFAAAPDFQNEGLRRIVVNAAYWATGLEKSIPEKSNVEIVGEYSPTFYGFNGFKKGTKPDDYDLK